MRKLFFFLLFMQPSLHKHAIIKDALSFLLNVCWVLQQPLWLKTGLELKTIVDVFKGNNNRL